MTLKENASTFSLAGGWEEKKAFSNIGGRTGSNGTKWAERRKGRKLLRTEMAGRLDIPLKVDGGYENA